MPRLGINGLGRIGRLALRAAFDAEYGGRAFDIALVNEIKGGVETAADVQSRLDAGADLVQGYSAFIYRGPLWAREVNRGLARIRRERAAEASVTA